MCMLDYKVWHKGQCYKLDRPLSPSLPHFQHIHSYWHDRLFLIKQNHEHTKLHPICSGVPEGRVLALYYMYFVYLRSAYNQQHNNSDICWSLWTLHLILTPPLDKLQAHLTSSQPWLIWCMSRSKWGRRLVHQLSLMIVSYHEQTM